MLVKGSHLRDKFINEDLSYLKDLYAQNKEQVISTLIKKCEIDYSQAEDLLGEAIISFYETVLSKKDFEVQSPRNYLIGIAINKHRNEKKKYAKIFAKESEVRLLIYDYDYYKGNQEYREKLKGFTSDALTELDSKCQKIISSYYLDGLSMKEIASALSLSSSDVAKTLKSRCYKKLLSLIKKISGQDAIRI